MRQQLTKKDAEPPSKQKQPANPVPKQCLLVENASTNQQPKPNTDAKTQPPAEPAGRR